MAAFRNMSTINVGIFTDIFDFNLTTLCLQYFLDREYKKICSNMAGVLPVELDSLLFFQVKGALLVSNSNYKGLQSSTYQLDDAPGVQLENGTWTGALGQLQSGIVDIWALDAFVTLERIENGFIYTTPVSIEKFGALMKRQTKMFSIETKSVTAGIGLSVYALLFAFLLANFLISYINERVQQTNERNSIWNLLLSFFPTNGKEWPNPFGLTRKVLMATSGFGILVLSSLYQAKQAEVLMIPIPPPTFTFKDIEYAVSSQDAKLMVYYEDSPILDYIKDMSESLSKSLKYNPAVFLPNVSSELETINKERGIYIDEEGYLLYLLSIIEPNLCQNYLYISFDEWTRSYSAFIMRKERVDILESMNVIIAERMSFVDNFIQANQLNEECRKHIFPVYTPDPKYSPLQLMKINGAFVFLFSFLCLSVCVLIIERISIRWTSLKNTDESETYEIRIHNYNKLSTETQQIIAEKYLKIRAAIENDVNT
jgi:hypothetical protein